MILATKYLPNYTYEDYCNWEGQWELIEGIPYAMAPTPIPAHQWANGSLFTEFNKALKKVCKNCKAYPPLDWKINNKTVLQPDLLIVCKKIEKKFLDFTPFLVAEILSPSTILKDRNVKKQIYQQEAVKYYIILDPKLKKIEVYELVKDKYVVKAITPKTFTFTFEDDCKAKVDFSNIWE